MDMFPRLRAAVAGQVELVKGFNDGKITREEIMRCVDIVLSTTPIGGDEELRLKLIEDAERDNKTWMDAALTISAEDGNWTAWLEKAKPDVQWRYWNRYAQLLIREGWSPNVVERLNETTDETLSWLNNPKSEGCWDRRGMVVGSVQSGKTANYSGLIAKAADAGYKVIIVLAGFHNNLRSQTQIRIEEGFLGYYKNESNKRVLTGVGLIAHDDKLSPNTITTRADNGDFNKAVATNFSSSIDRPLIFIIKKNASVLRNVLEYLEGQAIAQKATRKNARISDIPLLLIDDEADQGSINTNKDNLKTPDVDMEEDSAKDLDPTTLNGLIRKILNIFEQSAYVAYTATPFANIMIHKDASTSEFGDDLFPRSFITSISAPSNYIGPQKMFGFTDAETGIKAEGLPLTRPVDDYAASADLREKHGWMPPRHNKAHRPLFNIEQPIPPSLYKAIISYLLACAARALRGQGNKHSSMLVHVTRFTDVQSKVNEQVKEVLFQVRQCLVNGMGDSSFTIWEDMEHLWKNDFIPTTQIVNEPDCPAHDWLEIKPILPEIVQTVKVREINGTAGDVLDYEKHRHTGLNVIAIGGDKLSRGLTLEGLVVSYFTRPSKTYDTLMQMGRWFGYRNGFVDLSRLYAPAVLINWFRHISDADRELRGDFETMCAIGSTPENFGHRVRTHPLLQITSAVKMRNGTKEKCSYSGDLIQTIAFKTDPKDREHNKNCVEFLVSGSENTNHYFIAHSKNGKLIWKDVEAKSITRFLESYKTGYQTGLRRLDTNLIAKYISAQARIGNLIKWTVLISGKSSGRPYDIAGKAIGLIERRERGDSGDDKNTFKPSVITSPIDEEVIDLDRESWNKALDETRLVALKKDPTINPESISKPRGPQLRKYRSSTEGLLIIYPIIPPDEDEKDKGAPYDGDPYMGFAISFPGIGREEDTPVEYIVNSVAQENYEY